MSDKRTVTIPDGPRRRYEDVKAASASAADRISAATQSLVDTFREAYSPPRETAALVHNTAAE